MIWTMTPRNVAPPDRAMFAPEKEEPAGEEDDVAPGEVAAEMEHRVDQLHQPVDAGEERQPRHQREREAELPRAVAPVFGQPVGRDRDEDEVVDPEDDLERGQREEAGPDFRVEKDVHGSCSGCEFDLPVE
jgi:hypothetical protein